MVKGLGLGQGSATYSLWAGSSWPSKILWSAALYKL